MFFKSPYRKGDPLGIHDPSEAELGGVGGDSDGRFVKRSRKIVRGFFLMIIIALSWVTTIHLLRMSFHTERVLLSISPIAGNYSLPSRARPTRQALLNESASHYPGISHEDVFQLPPPITTTKVHHNVESFELLQ